MANTSYQNNIRTTTIGGWSFGFDARTEWSNVTRNNNTIAINGLRTRMRVNSGSVGASFSGVGVDVHTDAPSGTRRRNAGLGSGTYTRGQNYPGSAGNYSGIGVSANSVNISSRSGVTVNGGTGWTGPQNIDIPALGAPVGTTYLNSQTDTSINVRNDVTNWGANATAGSVRSYIADNSGFTGQTYLSTTDNANVNHTGLLPNTRYWFRGWADNGGGKSNYMTTINTATLANATETSKDVLATTVDFVLAVSQGYRTTTAKVQYRKQGDPTWLDSPDGAGGTPTIAVSGLLPNTIYEYRLAVTTTDGTWVGSTGTFTTMPAGKLVMPDGSVVNAIPRVVMPDGEVKMVNVNLVE